MVHHLRKSRSRSTHGTFCAYLGCTPPPAASAGFSPAWPPSPARRPARRNPPKPDPAAPKAAAAPQHHATTLSRKPPDKITQGLKRKPLVEIVDCTGNQIPPRSPAAGKDLRLSGCLRKFVGGSHAAVVRAVLDRKSVV